jgi:hypothetical protein
MVEWKVDATRRLRSQGAWGRSLALPEVVEDGLARGTGSEAAVKGGPGSGDGDVAGVV